MEREFKVGDKLRIREWEDMKSEFGLKEICGQDTIPCNFHFCDSMKPMCGKDFTVSRISNESYFSEENTECLDNQRYSISADMLEYRIVREFVPANDNEIRILFD